MLLAARGASALVAAEMAKAREASKQERQAPKARGGESRGTGTEAGVPPAMSRTDKIRADMNKKVVHPAGDVDAPELRKDAVLREMAAYTKEAAPKNDSKFDFLQYYWEARYTDRVDPSGKIVVPARWPHIGLLARLYAGIDTTSCQAERNFSTLEQVLISDARAGTLAHKTEKILSLRPYSQFARE